MRNSLKYTLLTWVLPLSVATATTINVPDDYDTIQAALTAADSSDTILVHPGTYYENIFWPDVNGIKLLSAGDSSNTIIDGGANGSVIHLNPSTATIDSTTEIQGFKITNGDNSGNGGGLFIDSASPVLTRLWVTGNTANYGGGIHIQNGSPTLSDMTVTGNAASYGGGLHIRYSSPTLTGVTVTGNTAYSGGGLFIDSGSPTLTDVTVTGNTADWGGGGLFIEGGNPTLTDVTVTGNTAHEGGGLYCERFASPSFDPINRSNIYFNYATRSGNDLYACVSFAVVVDTFTVMNPTDYHAYPVYNLTFDILHAKVEQVAADLYVNPAGDDANSGQSPSEPLRTISSAYTMILADRLNPRMIYLANGIYSPSTNGERFPLYMVRYISLAGESETGVILDADSLSRVLVSDGVQGITVENLTITGGSASYGGGLVIRGGGSPTLTGVTVTGNMAEYGGGLYILHGSPTLMHVTVTGNTARDGGGLYIEGGNPTLTDVTVTGNTANEGGGLYIVMGHATLTDVTVSGNTAGSGGGLFIWHSSSTQTRITVSRNLGVGLYFRYGSGTLTNVTITGNTRGIYVESGSPTIAGSNIAYNGTGLYNLVNSNTIDTDSVWWGDSSGPYHPQHNLGGLGDSVNAYVDIMPFLTEPDTAAPPIPIQNLVVDSIGYDFVELAWDASPMGDLAGYKVYFDTDSTGFPYTDTIDVGNNTSYTLSLLEPGFNYFIAATCYDTDGNESWYSKEVSATPTALTVEESSGIPTSFALHPAYPNPFNPTTTIRFDLPAAVDISIVVYDLMGREISRLVYGHVESGYHQVMWNGRDSVGREVPTGIYIARLSIIPPTVPQYAGPTAGVTPEFTKSIKMLLLK